MEAKKWMAAINISDEEQTAKLQLKQEELPNEAEGDQPRKGGSEKRAGTKNGENAETNVRTEMPQPEEVEEQQQAQQEQQQQNEEPLETLDQSILDILDQE